MNLITGSNGSCAHYLKAELAEWRGLARPDCDLLHPIKVAARLDALKPDVIYHLAADADVRGSFDRPAQVFHNNTVSTVNLFQACVLVGIRPVVVLCSTSEVYGNPGSWPITEDFSTERQTNPYAVSKRAQEAIARYYESAYGFPLVVTRAFGYVNPRRDNLALSNFARQIVRIERGEAHELRHGNLDSVRTFCDVRDIARGYVLAAGHPGWTLNIGSEEAVSIGECLKILCEYAQAEVLTIQDPALMRPLDITNIIPSCAEMRMLTHWEPKIALRDSMRWLLEEMRSQ